MTEQQYIEIAKADFIHKLKQQHINITHLQVKAVVKDGFVECTYELKNQTDYHTLDLLNKQYGVFE